MNCPVCRETALVMTERSGIEIDYCPQCRGVWLDRGELDKIIERSAPSAWEAPTGRTATTAVPAAPPAQAPPQAAPPVFTQRGDDRHYRRDHDDDDWDDHGHKRYRKRGGFLGELFDFD